MSSLLFLVMRRLRSFLKKEFRIRGKSECCGYNDVVIPTTDSLCGCSQTGLETGTEVTTDRGETGSTLFGCADSTSNDPAECLTCLFCYLHDFSFLFCLAKRLESMKIKKYITWTLLRNESSCLPSFLLESIDKKQTSPASAPTTGG
jgi:hypothetical protein